MTYLYVAVGGALGSVMRAWLAMIVARITGPQFPWGTILINIIGSFVIGFVGTMTANDSRFTDLRALVMVGICGGFTTFSSFSLQTLDLVRDGRPGQALGNVALSVVFCLLSVTAGHYSASVTSRPSSAARTTGPAVLAILIRPDQAGPVLDAAARLLPFGPARRIEALTVRLPPAAAILPSEEVLTAEREAELRSEHEHWPAQLNAILASRPGIDRAEAEGDVASVVVRHARGARAVVIARPERHETQYAHDCLHAALFDAGAPTLIVPPRHSAPFGRVVAIAWQDDDRAAKAVRTSLPILKAADAVHVLHAGGPATIPAILQQHGVKAEVCTVRAESGSTGRALLQAAHRCGADLMVMGAYAHGEWRERVFGGVTRTMLAEADLPLLLRH